MQIEIGKIYQQMLFTLKALEDDELVEVFHDIDDVETIEKIRDCADYFLREVQASESEGVVCRL